MSPPDPSNLNTAAPDSDPQGDVLTAEQVAVILQVRPCTVADWARRGIIPSYKLGKFRRYSKKDISAWVGTRRELFRGRSSAGVGHSIQRDPSFGA